MLYLNLALVLLLPVAAGLLFLSFFPLKKELFFVEKLALAFLTGSILIVMMMFFLALLRIPVDRISLLITLLLLSALTGWYLVKKRTFIFDLKEVGSGLRPDLRGFSLLEYLLLALMAAKTVYLFFVTLVKPVIDIDAISMYSAGAKGIFYAQTFLTGFVLGTIHDKPLFPYLSQAAVLIGLGTFNDCLIKVLTPVMFVCLLIIFYSALRRCASRLFALTFTFLLSTLPFMVFHAATAYSDFPQMVYYSLATVYLFLFMKELDGGRPETAYPLLTVSAILLGASVWVKKGGMAMAVVNVAILLVYLFGKRLLQKDKRARLYPAALTFVLLALPSVVFSQANFLFTGIKGMVVGAPADAAATAGEANRFQVVVSTVARKLFLYADWQLLWLLLVLVLIFCFRRAFKGALLYLLAIIVLDLCAIVFQFSFGASFQYLLDGTLLDRLVMGVVPVVLFYCACALAPYFEEETKTFRA
jgi:4-amino-4-deoxy-L-arabinose transferase-like glycosyltransferase